MRRAVVILLAVVPFALGAGVAQAHGSGDGGGWGDGSGGDHGTSSAQVVAVAGTVVSVDPTTGSFVANAFIPSGEGGGWGGPDHGGQGSGDQGGDGARVGGDFHAAWDTAPTTTQVTIPTNSATKFRVNGEDGTISDLAAGDRFVALFTGAPTDSLQTLVSNPALSVFAHTPPAQRQLYAFVGSVTAVNTTADTVTVQVTDSVPTGLVPAASDPATFTVSAETLFLGGSAANGLMGGSLSDVSVGDVVAGGEVGTAGETLAQVESSPLQVVVDFPASTTTTTGSARTAARARALGQALALFGYKKRTTSHSRKHHGKRTRSTHTHSKRK